MDLKQLGLTKSNIQTVGLTLLIGGLGAYFARLLGIPAPFLTGPATAVSLASLAGLKTFIPVLLRNTIFLIIGVSLGTSVTPEILSQAVTWPISLFIMCKYRSFNTNC